MRFTIASLLLLLVSGVSIAGNIPLDKFNLIADAQKDIEDISKKLDMLRDKLNLLQKMEQDLVKNDDFWVPVKKQEVVVEEDPLKYHGLQQDGWTWDAYKQTWWRSAPVTYNYRSSGFRSSNCGPGG